MVEFNDSYITRKSSWEWKKFGLLIVVLALAVASFIMVFVQYVNYPNLSSAICLFLLVVFFVLALYQINNSLERIIVKLDHNGLRKFREWPVGSRSIILSIECKDISGFYYTSKRIYVCYTKQPNCFETESFLFDSCDSNFSKEYCIQSKKLIGSS